MPKGKGYKHYARKAFPKKAVGAKDNSVTVWSNHNILEKTNRALQLANQMYRYVNAEIKLKDEDRTIGVSIPQVGQIINLSLIPQGDTEHTRDGSSAKLLRISGRCSIQRNSTDQFQTARMILFRGKNENGNVPSVTNFLEVASPFSPRNHDNVFQFKTIFDRSFKLDNAGTKTHQIFDINEKLFGHIKYDDATTTIENGGLYMLLIADGTVSATAAFYLRLTYTDN